MESMVMIMKWMYGLAMLLVDLVLCSGALASKILLAKVQKSAEM